MTYMSKREFNPATSSNTHSQARENAEITGLCADGERCGTPPGIGGEEYCIDCPNWQKDGMPAHSKYHREIKPGVFIDVYDVLQAWDVRNAALQHLIKKALQPGARGHKDLETDMNDIIASAKRAKELEQ